MSTALKIFPLSPQTPVTPEEVPEERSQSVSNSVTYYSHARANTREDEKFVDDEVAEYYCKAFGVSLMPPVAKAACLRALEAGMEQSLIYLAIDEASIAPRPSWNYAAAILRRLQEEKCLTGEAYIARQERWAARHRW